MSEVTLAERTAIRPLVRLLPGAAFLTYLVATVVLFYVGPWRYEVEAGGELLAFLVAAHLALGAGYLSGAFGRPRAAPLPVPVARIALACILLDLVLLFPLSELNTGSWIPPVWTALGDLGEAYQASLHLQATETPYVNYVRILLAPLLAAAVPLGIFYWRRLPRLGRAALILLVAGTLALFASMGMNRAIGEWGALFPWFVAAAHFSGVLRLRSRRQWLVVLGIALLNTAIFFVFFGATMNAREGSYAKLGTMQDIEAQSRLIPAPRPVVQVDPAVSSPAEPPEVAPRAADAPPAEAQPTSPTAAPDPPATTVVPTATVDPPAAPAPAVVALNGFSAYLTQGYYAVGLALQEPFVPMWGVGHSVFLTRQAVRLTGDESIPERSYPERIEKHGWNAQVYWATIYPWIASDVGFLGAVVVVFLIGHLLARVWIDTLGGENPFAVALLGQLILMLYYFPAHNRVLQIGEGVTAFWGLLLLWWLGRNGHLARWWRRRASSPG